MSFILFFILPSFICYLSLLLHSINICIAIVPCITAGLNTDLNTFHFNFTSQLFYIYNMFSMFPYILSLPRFIIYIMILFSSKPRCIFASGVTPYIHCRSRHPYMSFSVKIFLISLYTEPSFMSGDNLSSLRALLH